VGNAYHGWKTHNRKVRLCQIFHFERFGYECGEITDRENFIGKEYFAGLYERYEKDVRPNISLYLKQYHVSYIVRDNETDRVEFRPQLIPRATQVYSDGRFEIYYLRSE
jgi:hypothetical protein